MTVFYDTSYWLYWYGPGFSLYFLLYKYSYKYFVPLIEYWPTWPYYQRGAMPKEVTDLFYSYTSEASYLLDLQHDLTRNVSKAVETYVRVTLIFF